MMTLYKSSRLFLHTEGFETWVYLETRGRLSTTTSDQDYPISRFEPTPEIEVNPKLVKELRRKYGLAKLQKNKAEITNLERQLKYYDH